MLKLLRMDLILNWKALALSYALWSVLWLGGPAVSGSGDMTFGGWSGMVSVACAFLPIMMIGREDKFRAWTLACSLPVRRDAIVASRYVGGWLTALLGVAVAAAAMGALALFGIRPLLPPTPTLPVVVVAVIGITLALMMPLPIRYGIAGVIGFLVAAQLLGIVVLLASALFRMPAVEVVESAVRQVFAAGRRLRETWGPIRFSAALLAAVVALNAASYALSARIYRRREF